MPKLRKLRCGVLLLHGDADTVVPIELARAAEAVAKEGTAAEVILHIIAGAGHTDLLQGAHVAECAQALADGVRSAAARAARTAASGDPAAARAELLSLSVRELKARLMAAGTDATGATSKADLADALLSAAWPLHSHSCAT